MKRLKIRAVRLVPVVVVMGAIFFLSHQPGDSLYMPPVLPGFDKIAHMAVYAVLAGAILYAFQPELASGRILVPLLITVGICFLYGLSDEFHQSFIPGRFVSAADLGADALGSVIVCVVWLFCHRRKSPVLPASNS